MNLRTDMTGPIPKEKTWKYALMDKYPVLFRDKDDVLKSLMKYGVQCNTGWKNIIEDLTKELAELNMSGYSIQVVQIKEKMGTLRYYIEYDHTNEDLWKVIEGKILHAEHLSAITCELCASTGALHIKDHWYKTLCTKCADIYSYKKVKRD